MAEVGEPMYLGALLTLTLTPTLTLTLTQTPTLTLTLTLGALLTRPANLGAFTSPISPLPRTLTKRIHSS